MDEGSELGDAWMTVSRGDLFSGPGALGHGGTVAEGWREVDCRGSRCYGRFSQRRSCRSSGGSKEPGSMPQGTSAYELLTGNKVDDWLTWLGFPPSAARRTERGTRSPAPRLDSPRLHTIHNPRSARSSESSDADLCASASPNTVPGMTLVLIRPGCMEHFVDTVRELGEVPPTFSIQSKH